MVVFHLPSPGANRTAMRTTFREEPCTTALNPVKGMFFRWSLNPYMGCAHRCTFCYVRGFEQRADRPSGDAYGRSIRVKTNIIDILRRELRRPSWRGEEVTIGAATDPYQPAEGTYRLTRGCIQALSAFETPFGIITRGPLVIRDVDVLAAAASRVAVTVSISVPTLDLDIWRATEPGTAPPLQRLRAINALARAGLDAGVALAPLLPGLSDAPAQLDAVTRAAADAGAQFAWANVLNLRRGTREHFLETLSRSFPSLVPAYAGLYARGFLTAARSSAIVATADTARARHGLPASPGVARRERQPALL
jgi:DNA repair photolyase